MARVANNILELIGDAPMVRLNKVAGESGAEFYWGTSIRREVRC